MSISNLNPRLHHVGHDPENYTYFEDGSVKAIEVGGVIEAEYQYDISGLRTRVDLGNGTWTDYAYDELYRLTAISHNSPGGEFLRFDYTYDVDALGDPVLKGLKTGMTRTEDGVVVQREKYVYDDLYRLAKAVRENDISTNDDDERIVYPYDTVGNITSVVTYGEGAVDGVLDEPKTEMYYGYFDTNDPFHGGLNRLEQIDYYDNTDPLNDYIAKYDYDLNGNTKSEETTFINTVDSEFLTYTWDYDNRLTKIVSGVNGVIGEYKYDALYKRMKKSANGIDSAFTYDGINLVYQSDSDGKKYAYLHGPLYNERLTLIVDDAAIGNKHYYFSDALFSISAIVDSNRDVESTASYLPYGEIDALIDNSSVFTDLNNYTYAGYQIDKESKFSYLGFRYYNSATRRFINEDYISSINRYAYTYNNPVMYIDYLGLCGVPPGLESVWPKMNPLNVRPYGNITASKVAETVAGELTGATAFDEAFGYNSGNGPDLVLLAFLVMGLKGPGKKKAAKYARKVCPNSYGRRGGPSHVKRISEAEERLKAKGWKTLSGGSKPEKLFANRYPDLVMEKGAKKIAVQVGKITKRKVPIARERRALDDLRKNPYFDRVYFLNHY